MSDTPLREFAASVSTHEAVEDAWVAKSFTDRLLVVEVAAGEPLPAAVEDRLATRGLRSIDEVYDLESRADAFAGTVDGASRYRFVDVETRGEHQSYVVE